MARRRLGVVLLLPDDVALEVDTLRRALGDNALGRIPAHITLVPPVNVREESLDDAIALIRAAAGAERGPVRLHLGPVTTFHPVTPVVYLRVGGDVDAVHRLRAAVFHPPLERTVDYEFVPHVTLGDEVEQAAIEGALSALRNYSSDVDIAALTLMEQGDDRVWHPLADAWFDSARRGPSGGLHVDVTVHAVASPGAERLGGQRPLVIEARIDGAVVGLARGRIDAPTAWIDEIAVADASRGLGIGGSLVREFASAAGARGAAHLIALPDTAPPAFLERMGFMRITADLYSRDVGTSAPTSSADPKVFPPLSRD